MLRVAWFVVVVFADDTRESGNVVLIELHVGVVDVVHGGAKDLASAVIGQRVPMFRVGFDANAIPTKATVEMIRVAQIDRVKRRQVEVELADVASRNATQTTNSHARKAYSWRVRRVWKQLSSNEIGAALARLNQAVVLNESQRFQSVNHNVVRVLSQTPPLITRKTRNIRTG